MPPKKPPKEGHNPEDAGAETAEHDPEPAAAVMASMKQLLELQQQMMQQQQQQVLEQQQQHQQAMEQQRQHLLEQQQWQQQQAMEQQQHQQAMEQQQQCQQALEQQQQKAHSDQLQLFEKLMAVHLVRGEPSSSDKENRSADHSTGKGAEHQPEQPTLQESGSSMPTEETQLAAQSVASTTSSVTVSTTPLLGSVDTDTKSQAHSLPAINLASPGTAAITCHGISMASSLDQGRRHPTNPKPGESTGIPFPPPSLSMPPLAITSQPGKPQRGDTWPDSLQQAATQPATAQVVSSASADWEAMVGSGNPTPSARNPLMTPALQELYEQNQLGSLQPPT